MIQIDALTKDESKQQAIFEEYFNTNRKMSHTKMSYSLSGFFSPLSLRYKKDKYIKQFFQRLPEVLNNQPL